MKLLISWLVVAVVLIVLISSVLGLMVFRFKHPNNFERMVVSKIKQETPYLANFETIYSLAFTNFQDNMIFSDNYYIRQDEATVFYGYSLKDATIKIKHKGDDNILWVRLPNPERVSTDRKIVSIDEAHAKYS